MRMRDIVLKQVVGDGPGWCAWHDGEKDDNHSGWGTTPAEAVADLDRLDQERAEALEDAERIEEQAGGILMTSDLVLFLKEHREAKGMSAEDMGRKLGIERESVYRLEREAFTRLNPEKQVAYAKALNIAPQDLWRPPGHPSLSSIFMLCAVVTP